MNLVDIYLAKHGKTFYIDDDTPVPINTEEDKQKAKDILDSKLVMATLTDDKYKISFYERIYIKLTDLIE